ncbi:MAG: phosphoenolpyruvate carboxylase [Pseudomonadota bacterium]
MADLTSYDRRALEARLTALRGELETDPLANPVRRLGYELSKALEAGELTLADTEALIFELSCKAVQQRRSEAKAYLGDQSSLDDAIAHLTDGCETEEAFRARLARPTETVVFTGHPTFAMTKEGVASILSDGDTAPATTIRTSISLADEHDEACRALRFAGDAVASASRAALTMAHRRFGEGFRSMLPAPVSIATWVGYDLDGRQDIGWERIILHRLVEKRIALADYIARLEPLRSNPAAEQCLATLKAGLARTEAELAGFSDEEALKTKEGLVAAANRLTADGDGRLVSLNGIIKALQEAAKTADAKEAIDLLTAASLMAIRGLGVGEIHFRLNASQIRNAARSVLPLHPGADLFGRSALTAVNDAIANVQPMRVNFGSLAAETSSARRIAIASAQVIKHIDADTPIRLLIAECENPLTVLTAIFLAKRYGAAHAVDICPLFETAPSFERSRRILSLLLEQKAFQDQVSARGRVAIEAGFSDAGRFMGQLPAGLAIERLQIQLADEMAAKGLDDLEAVVFNTHGESMGRGGHPGSIKDRSQYIMSPHAREQFRAKGIRLVHESSFQGGDGFSWFNSKDNAEAVVSGLLRAVPTTPPEAVDPFYQRTEASIDFFNFIKDRQKDLFHFAGLASVVMGPGLAMLPIAGSRKTKRQFDRSTEEDLSLRRIRAISHNGSLEQIGYLANIHEGVGDAIATEPEAYTDLSKTSDRFHRLMALVARATELSDMKTLIAYMKLYDGSFWATRPINGREPHTEQACGNLAHQLAEDRRYFDALQTAARLRPSVIALKRALSDMGFAIQTMPPLNLDLLHAVRLALIQHMFLIAGKLPAFSGASGFSREEVFSDILALNIASAAQRLREGFPQAEGQSMLDSFAEPADQPSTDQRYASVATDTIAPLERAFEQCQRISLAVSHHFRAIG